MQKRINTAFEKDKVCLAAQFIIGNSVGSGIFVTYQTEIYFCTARHVVYQETVTNNTKTFTLKNATATVKSYPKDSEFKVINELNLDLVTLSKANQISFHPTFDLCTIRIGKTGDGKMWVNNGIRSTSKNFNLYVADSTMIKAAKDIEIGEETYVIGYPKALAKFQPQNPLYNYELPLVRKGIISSMNDYQTFVIDCAVYGGNSGGPVFVAENLFTQTKNGFNMSTKTYLVGIVTKFIPLVNSTAAIKSGNTKTPIPILENSGYGVCIAFDLLENEISKLYSANKTKT